MKSLQDLQDLRKVIRKSTLWASEVNPLPMCKTWRPEFYSEVPRSLDCRSCGRGYCSWKSEIRF